MEEIKLLSTPKNIPPIKSVRQAEKILGYNFPQSYKNFVQQYGSGLLCGLFVILVPAAENKHLSIEISSKENEEIIKKNIQAGLWDKYKEQYQLLKQLKVFGVSENGDLLAWDITQIINEKEYPIYLLDNEQTAIIHVANSLTEFIRDFCLGEKIDELFPIGKGESWNLPPSFKPYE